MAKKAVTIRLEEELEKEVREIGEIIELNTPGAEANFATLSRYAIEDYIKRYKQTCKQDTISIDIPVENLNREQLESIKNNLLNIIDVINTKDIDQIETKRESEFLQTSYIKIEKVIKSNILKIKADMEE